jgi:hypothetical protein
MKAIKLILALCFATGSLNLYAEELPKVSLTADLNIERKCKPSDSFCSILVPIGFGGQEITLYPQNDDVVSSPFPTPQPPTTENTHHRGFLTTVKELDGLRFIGIISIDRYRRINPHNEKEEIISFTITTEILDGDGVSAKMSIRVNNMSELNNVTLAGRSVSYGSNEYEPSFFVGKAIARSCPGNIPLCPSDISVEKAEWDVLFGQLK